MSADPSDDSPPRRHRRLRRGHVVAVLSSILALAAAGYVVHRSTVDAPVTRAELDEAWLRQYPPTATPTVLDDRLPGWTTYVWLSTNDHLCTATTGPVGSNGKDMTCFPAPAPLRGEEPPALVSKPLFQVIPMDTGKTLAIGTIRGSAATVDVTFFGTTVTSPVVRITAPDHGILGAYAAWLPRKGHRAIDWADITEVVARDRHGRPLDRIT